MWERHHNKFDEHIYYVMNNIQKNFNMGILNYAEHVCDMFEMDKLLPHPNRNNEEYHEDSWDIMDMHYKEEIICKAIKD